ncbi:hypothetical protein F4679DRAFT_559982 [Xylaria curta]|nr:hypothetical protein F4679DRAFT_559982 [Xylaria curta]
MMEIDEDDLLQGLALGHSMIYSAWPALLSRLLVHIEKIAHEAFPIPNLPPPPPPPAPFTSASTLPSSIPRGPDPDLPEGFLAPLPSSPTEPRPSSSSSDTNKENNPVLPPTIAPLPPAPTPAATTSAQLPPGTLPPQLASMLADITSYLKSNFPTYPPHTIQRIAELVINPKQHYRSLASYLHALDRVVRVTSGANIYPLPSTHAEIPGSLANGVLETTSRASSWASPGSDEALGGALLTPIPWITHNQRPISVAPAQAQLLQSQLQPQPQPSASAQEVPAEFEGEVRTESTETIDGPNGAGSVETVSVSVNGIPSMGARGVSVTQGELLRQEQEAGLVPISQLVPSHHILVGSNASAVAQQQQQQIQARIHQQRALAQSQNQARVPSSGSPDSPTSVSNTVSTPSSATLDGESVDAAADKVLGAIGSIHSNNAEDQEKPHARGPEEIGADDLGPQTASSSTLPASTTTGSVRQGIDIQAAVGRKPLDTSASSKSEGNTKNNEDNDKMEIDENDRAVRSSTPKRDAEDQLGGSSKKLKEDPDSGSADADSKPAQTEPKSEENDAMDKD